MPQYKYKAITKLGERIEGVQEVNSENELLTLLRSKEYTPIEISKYVEQDLLKGFSTYQRIKLKELSIFCRQFYFIINAGVSILNCLDILRRQTENRRLRRTVDILFNDVQKGESLSNSMKKHESVFPQLLIYMVHVGEISGNLDSIMDKMARHYEKENKIQHRIKGAMMYPAILGITSVVVVIFLLTFVMPTFVSMFTGTGVELPGPTKALIGISDFMTSYWYVIIILLLLFVYGIRTYGKSDNGRLVFDRMKTKLPIVNRSIEKIVSSRFASTLSILLGSGVSLIESIEIVAQVVRNKIVEDGLRQTNEELRKGIDLSDSIRRINFFPPLVVSMVKIGQDSGSLDEVLRKLADFYDDEVDSAIQSLMSALEPAMIIVMALVIGFIVIAMLLPMFGMGLTV